MSSRTVDLVVWGVLVLALVGCEVAALVSGGRVAGLRRLFGALTARPVVRTVLVVGWMWLGWHFFAR